MFPQLEAFEPGEDISLCVTSSTPLGADTISAGAVTQGGVVVHGAAGVSASTLTLPVACNGVSAVQGQLRLPKKAPLSTEVTIDCLLFVDAFPDAQCVAAAIYDLCKSEVAA